MNRRQFLAGSILTGGVFLAGVRSGAAQSASPSKRDAIFEAWARRIQSILSRGGLPIIDLQATYIAESTNVTRMVANMDSLDVAQIAFAAANARTGAPSVELHRADPERFIPTTNSGEFQRWWTNPLEFLAVLRADLASGDYFFMGEHEFRHLPSPEQIKGGKSNRDITIPINGPAGDTLFRLSAETGIAFQIHYEIEDSLLPALEDMLARHPTARVIWCHLAMIRNPDRARRYTPRYVSDLIERSPGLYFDLAVPPAGSIYRPTGARHSTLFAPSGEIEPAWRAIIETFPDRFLAASDYRPQIEAQYAANIERQRAILAALNEPTRYLVAYGNAWRLVTGKSWAR